MDHSLLTFFMRADKQARSFFTYFLHVYKQALSEPAPQSYLSFHLFYYNNIYIEDIVLRRSLGMCY